MNVALQCEVYHLRRDGADRPGGKSGTEEGEVKVTLTQGLKRASG